MLKFDIVVPNYNQSHFLPFALESLRFQSVPINLAVMDGGSTDDFKAAIEPYSDMITFLRSMPDGGQAAAIKDGFNGIPGDIVAWLNADDYYFPGALERVAAFFEADPNLDVVYGDAVHVSRDGFFLSYFPAIQEFNAHDLTRTCFICQPACFVRRSAYEKVGGVNPLLHFTMDWDLWCRLAEAGAKFHYVHDVLAAVRYYPGTKTLSGNKQRYLEIWQMERKYGKRLLPLSWPGFYLYDLMFKEEKTISESIAFVFLQFLRQLKKIFTQMQNSQTQTYPTNYGFHKWKKVVVGSGTIYLPWYDKRRLNKIHLQVKPDNGNYTIVINDDQQHVVSARRGDILINLPYFDKPCMKIAVKCLDQHDWTLLDFSGDLAS